MKKIKREYDHGKHHQYSPSSLARLERCPGSLYYKVHNDVKQSENKNSIEGTNLHDCVKYGCFEFDDGFKCNREQKQVVQESLDLIEELSLEGQGKVYKEIEVSVKDETGKELTAGTADVVIVFKEAKKVIVVDHKFGGTAVKVKGNIQLIAYTTGVIQWLYDQGIEIEDAIMCINQPRVFGAIYADYGNYATNLERIKSIINRVESPTANINPSPEACKYCDARWVCDVQQESYDMITNLTLREVMDCSDPEIMSDIYDHAIEVEGVIKAIKAKMHELVRNNGGEFGRYKEVTTKGRKKLTSNQDAFNLVSDTIDAKAFSMLCKEVALGSLESEWVNTKYEQAKSEGVKITKKSLKESFKELIKPAVEVSAGSTKIVLKEK